MTDRTQHRRWVFLGARPSKSDMDKNRVWSIWFTRRANEKVLTASTKSSWYNFLILTSCHTNEISYTILAIWFQNTFTSKSSL